MFLLARWCSATVSAAQDAAGRIFGTVYDPQGAVVPDVHVTADQYRDSGHRGTQPRTKTGYSSYWRFLLATYKVTAEHTGFRTVMTAEQKLQINQALRIDIKLEVGSTNQTVDVGAEAAASRDRERNLWDSRLLDER